MLMPNIWSKNLKSKYNNKDFEVEEMIGKYLQRYSNNLSIPKNVREEMLEVYRTLVRNKDIQEEETPQLHRIAGGIKRNKSIQDKKEQAEYKITSKDDDTKTGSSSSKGLTNGQKTEAMISLKMLNDSHKDKINWGTPLDFLEYTENNEETTEDIGTLQRLFFEEYGVNFIMLVRKVFVDKEEVVTNTLKELMDEYPEVKEVFEDLLRKHRSSNYKFDFFEYMTDSVLSTGGTQL